MPNVYRKAGSGSLEYFALIGEGSSAREIALGTVNLRTALRLYDELGGAARRATSEVAPAGSRGPILPRSVHHALAYYLHRGSADLADATRRMYTQKAGQLVRLLGDVPLAQLGRGQLDSYIARRRTEGVALETVRKELKVLRQALKLARDLDEFERDLDRLFPRIRLKYRPQRRWLPFAEVEALLGALRPHRQLWVLVIVYTSARYSEAAGLLWEEINFDGDLVHLDGTKTGQADRFVPLHPELRRVLWPQRQKSGPILRPWAKPHRDLQAACKRAGIAPANFNALRRTYASWLKQAGVESFAVAKLMGHTTSKMVELNYGHLNSDVYKNAVAKLPALSEQPGAVAGASTARRAPRRKRERPTGAKKCERCGETFSVASNRQKFCSAKCRRAVARVRLRPAT